MNVKTKKATFNLHTDVLTALDEVMAQGIAPSKNALVERALLKELKELRNQARKAMWQEAVKDPLFICKKCGRAARDARNLCSPRKLES